LLLAFPVIGFLVWISFMSPLWLADAAAMSRSGTNPLLADPISFRQALADRLPPNPYSWLQRKPTRAQILKRDHEYLDPEHLALPRMQKPYQDINKWSTEKRERHIRGLDWLLAHADGRLSRE
jgi:hypothetical protein